MPLALGWDRESSKAAHARLLRSRRYVKVTGNVKDTPAAKSLTKYRRRHLEQGQAGTCWAHAPTQLAEITMTARGYKSFDVCRRLVAYVGKQLEGGGNPDDGGNGIDALDAMTQEKGAGLGHESLCPYSDQRRVLGTRPEAKVYEDAKKSHLVMPIDVNSDDDFIRLIGGQDTPVCIGIWWPYGWDNEQTFMSQIGRGEYGHELLVTGYAKPGVFDQYGWWQLDNWHGLLYPALPDKFAAKVDGYKPIGDRTSDFWVRADVLSHVGSYGDYERVSATDLEGANDSDWIWNLFEHAFVI